jgi:hypothetical protein
MPGAKGEFTLQIYTDLPESSGSEIFAKVTGDKQCEVVEIAEEKE